MSTLFVFIGCASHAFFCGIQSASYSTIKCQKGIQRRTFARLTKDQDLAQRRTLFDHCILDTQNDKPLLLD